MINKKKLLLVGSGGHTTACIDVVEMEKKYEIIGLIDIKKNKILKKYKVVGNISDLIKLRKKTKNIFISIGQIKTVKLRIEILEKIKKYGFTIIKIVSPLSYVSKYSSIGEGTIIMHGVHIGPDVKIGKNCIINTKANIEHGSVIADNCHISTSVTVNGDVKIEAESFIGSNSVIKEGITIKRGSFIKMGSVIKK